MESECNSQWKNWWQEIHLNSPVADQKFYITTAINYTNGKPHLGHAYEAVTTDVIARYHRVYGRRTFFLTGTDEHGQKIADAAAASKVDTLQYCTEFANQFKKLNEKLLISNDDFVRTTEERHKVQAKWFLQRAIDNGDIYTGTYEGWYNVKEEAFVTDTEAEMAEFKDASGKPLVRMREESYFFKMSNYQKRLLEHLKENPTFIRPESAMELIRHRLEQDELRDLSISRTKFSWGIAFPPDEKHVMYVWFDALTNYLTGAGYPNRAEEMGLWPADYQIIGKDITWFHTVIWPCMLMSANLPLPKSVFSHGFVLDSEGNKMSKSVGNVIDPHDIIAKYPVDSIRLFMIIAAPYGSDPYFKQDTLVTHAHNAFLCKALGNLVVRVTNLISKNCQGVVPDCESDPNFVKSFNLPKLVEETEEAFATLDLKHAADLAMEAVSSVNLYLTEREPWKMKDAEQVNIVLRTAVDAIYACTHFLSPYAPTNTAQIFDCLSTPPRAIPQLSAELNNLAPGTEVKKTFKFKQIEEKREVDLKAEVEKNKQQKQQKKQQQNQQKKGTQSNQPPFTKLDIRVGTIVEVWKHPDSTKLYCEKIDIGGDAPIEVASGLQAHYTLEQMQGQRVLVFVNLRPSKLAGFMSHGMVLCADNGEKVEFITPPAGAANGDKVICPGLEGDPVTPNAVRNQKVLETVLPLLRTNADRVATFDGVPLATPAGPCSSSTLVDSPIK